MNKLPHNGEVSAVAIAPSNPPPGPALDSPAISATHPQSEKLRPLVAALSVSSKALPLASIHCEQKVNQLTNVGIRTLGDLAALDLNELLALKGVGRHAVDAYKKRLEQVSLSLDSAGNIDWIRFCEAADIEFLPKGLAPRSGTDFLAMLPTVAKDIADALPDCLERMILKERIIRSSSDQRTLEEIADLCGMRMTRERVRQREQRLIERLYNALFHDEYSNLPFHFSPGFAAFWKRAILLFEDQGEIPFTNFSKILCAAWSVRPIGLIEHLPFITSILTGKSQIPSHLRVASGRSVGHYRKIGYEALMLPVSRLPLGRYAAILTGIGCNTVSDVIENVCLNDIQGLGTKAMRPIFDVLDALTLATNVDGSLDWRKWACISGLPPIPSCAISTASDFISSLEVDIGSALELGSPSLRAARIYKYRTSRPARSRPTLAKTAQFLNTYVSVVKREETDLLASLHKNLIKQDTSESGVLYMPSFVSYWQELWTIYNETINYLYFCNNVARRWNVDRGILEQAMPTIWAVLTLYPQRLERS